MAEVRLPALGDTVTHASISVWLKAIGDRVSAGEPIAEASTDKVDTEIESPSSGVLASIVVGVGEEVAVGDVIAVVSPGAVEAPQDNTPATTSQTVAGAGPPAISPVPTADRPCPVDEDAPSRNAPDHSAPVSTCVLLSPAVRQLLSQYALDPEAVRGSGVGGRITVADVKQHLVDSDSSPPARPPVDSPAGLESPDPSAPVAAVSPGGDDDASEDATRVPMSRIRLATARHMTASLATSPHAWSSVEIDYSNVDRVRRGLRDTWRAREGFSLTYLPFIARALVDGLARFPHLNASVDDKDLIVHSAVNIGIAVDVDHQGLMVPVVRDAHTKRLAAIARDINRLAAHARSRQLTAETLAGGTITITNNGSAGSVMSSAIIKQPEVAIVSTEAVIRRPVAVTVPDGSEAVVVRPIGFLTMSWDHRAFDGAYAANFLALVKQILETRDWTAEC